jgi:hypothetical protein
VLRADGEEWETGTLACPAPQGIRTAVVCPFLRHIRGSHGELFAGWSRPDLAEMMIGEVKHLPSGRSAPGPCLTNAETGARRIMTQSSLKGIPRKRESRGMHIAG